MAPEAQRGGGAEGATPGATGLRGNAQGQLAPFLLVVRDEHRLDGAAVVGAKAELAGAIRGLHRAVEAQRQQGAVGQERVPQGARHRGGRQGNAHAAHAARPRPVQPTEELLGAKRRLTRARNALAQLSQGERPQIQSSRIIASDHPNAGPSTTAPRQGSRATSGREALGCCGLAPGSPRSAAARHRSRYAGPWRARHPGPYAAADGRGPLCCLAQLARTLASLDKRRLGGDPGRPRAELASARKSSSAHARS